MKIIKAFLLIFAVILIGGFQNCSSQVSFTEASSTTTSATSTCTVNNTEEQIRIIFMVDNSGSTATTDANQYYRVTAVKNFLAKYGAKTNFTYGFGFFSESSSYFYDISSGTFKSTATQSFGTASDISAALSIYQNIVATGSTPYQAAFNAVKTAVINDTTGGTSNYVLVFMSDGAPKDLVEPIDTSIASLVSSLNAAVVNKGHLLTISTLYFGAESDSAAQDHLKVMASDGGGQFVDANQSTDFEVDDLIAVPGC